MYCGTIYIYSVYTMFGVDRAVNVLRLRNHGMTYRTFLDLRRRESRAGSRQQDVTLKCAVTTANGKVLFIFNINANTTVETN